MTVVPPFARALQGRRIQTEHQARGRKVRDDPPQSVDPPEVYPPIERRKSQEPEIVTHDSSYLDEIRDLRLRVTELESQNTDLVTENKRFQRTQVELETERQLATERKLQLDEAIGQLRDEQLKTKCLNAQVQQLENLLNSKKQLTDVKEQMLQRIQTEYQQVMTDYTRILDLNGLQTGQLRQAKVKISELEAQVEELKGLTGRNPSQPSPRTRTVSPSHRFTDDFLLFDTEKTSQDIPRQFDGPEAEFENLHTPSPKQIESLTSHPKARTPMKRAALVDNIKFGGEPSEIIVDDVDGMTVDEMKDLLSVLRAQKEEVERRLNKAPEKGRLMAHVRREQEQQEHELDVLSRRIAKIRFALRKIHEL